MFYCYIKPSICFALSKEFSMISFGYPIYFKSFIAFFVWDIPCFSLYFRISVEEAILSTGFVPLKISSMAQKIGRGFSVAFIILRIDSASAM